MHLCGGVVSHHEVVAVGVLHLMNGDGLGKGEDAPVCEAADDTAILEDEGANGLNNSNRVSTGGSMVNRFEETYSFTSGMLPGRTCLNVSS